MRGRGQATAKGHFLILYRIIAHTKIVDCRTPARAHGSFSPTLASSARTSTWARGPTSRPRGSARPATGRQRSAVGPTRIRQEIWLEISCTMVFNHDAGGYLFRWAGDIGDLPWAEGLLLTRELRSDSLQGGQHSGAEVTLGFRYYPRYPKNPPIRLNNPSWAARPLGPLGPQ